MEEGWVNNSTHATTKYVLASSNSSRVNQGTISFCPQKLSLHNEISDFKLLAEGSNAAALWGSWLIARSANNFSPKVLFAQALVGVCAASHLFILF